MEVIKNKNLLEFSLTNRKGISKSYRYNINDGCIYGPSGRALKNCPSGLARALTHIGKTNYERLLSYVCGVDATLYNGYAPEQAKDFSIFYDKLLSLGYTNIEVYRNFIECMKYGGYLGRYKKVDDSNIFKANHFLCYVFQNEVCDMLNYPTLKSLNEEEFREVIRVTVLSSSRNDYTFNEAEIMAYYLYRGYINEVFEQERLHQGESLIHNYITYCRKLHKPYAKTNNFLRELAETKREYNLRKAELDKAIFTENYSKHPKAWNFTYNGYTVLIPQTGEDLIQEGRSMHHCVGSYVDRVLKNETYICFIRKVAKPDKPYITCQVSPHGEIGQYYMAHDKLISSDEDKTFRKAYQQYLNEIW